MISDRLGTSVADPDLGCGAFLAPVSGMGKNADPGSGSGMNSLDHISESFFGFKF
jgi:hypothetical protein